jgi:hypothetical protein
MRYCDHCQSELSERRFFLSWSVKFLDTQMRKKSTELGYCIQTSFISFAALGANTSIQSYLNP